MSHFKKKQKDFFAAHKNVKSFVDKKHVMLFLDFDGTLAAIVNHYESAKILRESKILLKKIAKVRDCSLAIVSGRALADVKKRVGIERITYAGNHGLEIEGIGVKSTYFVKTENRIRFKIIKNELRYIIKGIKGAFLEDKGLTLSLHYRQVRRADLASLRGKITDYLSFYVKNKEIFLNEGKKVFEIRPNVNWDKGKAVLWLMAQFKKKNAGKEIWPIFIGDDQTDESAFKALKFKGLCIRVGRSNASAAPYFLKDIKQVARFLREVINAKAEHRGE